MKRIEFSVKQTKFLYKYFGWVPFVYGVGTILLTIYIFEIFGIYEKLSFPLYECPGFFLCFIDHIPIISYVVGIAVRDPLPMLVGIILFLIICFPPMYIFMNVINLKFKEEKEEKIKKRK